MANRIMTGALFWFQILQNYLCFVLIRVSYDHCWLVPLNFLGSVLFLFLPVVLQSC